MHHGGDWGSVGRGWSVEFRFAVGAVAWDEEGRGGSQAQLQHRRTASRHALFQCVWQTGGRQPTVRSDTDQSLLGCQIAVRSGGQKPHWQMAAARSNRCQIWASCHGPRLPPQKGAHTVGPWHAPWPVGGLDCCTWRGKPPLQASAVRRGSTQSCRQLFIGH